MAYTTKAQWVRISMVREPNHVPEGIRDSKDVVRVLKGYFGDRDREEFLVACLDGKNRVIAVHSVSTGSLMMSLVHPREVLKVIVLSNAAGVIFAHNHPSGDPTPSSEDIEVTRRLAELCKLLGVRCVDHVIFGDDQFTSFAEQGYPL